MIAAKLRCKFYAAFVYGLRWLFRFRITSRFITGDGIANLADVQLYPPVRRRNSLSVNNPISAARVIFCPSHEIDRMFEEFQDVIKAEILIFGNSDHDFTTFSWPIPPTVKRIFLQNSFITNDFFRTLPIGIENIRYGKNGIPILFSRFFAFLPKRNLLLVGPFSDTHPERKKLNELRGNMFRINHKRLSPVRLSWKIATHKYVAVPRETGLIHIGFGKLSIVGLYLFSCEIDGQSHWQVLICQ